MGIFSRTVSFTRYKVEVPPGVGLDNLEQKELLAETVGSGLKSGAHRTIGASGDLVGIGWVNPEDYTNLAPYFHLGATGGLVPISLRVDTVSLPAKAVEASVREKIAEALELTGQERVNSKQRRDLRAAAKEELQKNAVPNIRVIDALWNVLGGELFLGTTTMKSRELFVDWFKEHFGLSLTPMIPYLVALDSFPRATEDSLATIEPSFFA